MSDKPEEEVPRGQSYAVMPDSDPDKIRLTPTATEHMVESLNKHGQGIGIRLAIKKSGCAGFKYVVDYVEVAQEGDHVFAIDDNYAIYVDPKSFAAVKGTTIDFVKEGLNEVLKYYNPNEASACGCGESFAVKEQK